jgi:hypothetical protein
MTQLDLSRLAGMPLGTIIVRSGFAPADVVEQAILENTATGRRLGEVLLERGILTDDQLAQALELQGRPKDEVAQPVTRKPLVRLIWKDGRTIAVLRCRPQGKGAVVDYEAHSDGSVPHVLSGAFDTAEAGFAFFEQTTESFRLLGCETGDSIGGSSAAA